MSDCAGESGGWPVPEPLRLLLSKAEAATALNVCIRTLDTLDIPSIKLGNRRLYSVRDLEQFIEQKKQEAVAK